MPAAPDKSASPSAPGRAAPIVGAGLAMVLLVSMNLFNYIDRSVLAAVEPDVQRALLPSLDPEHDSSIQFMMGLLPPAFLVSYMIAAPAFGWLAQWRSRWGLIAIGVVLWSLATGASGLASSFWILLVTRCFVGIGEAAYGPVAPAILSDYYPLEMRGRVLSWFYAAIPVGSALGYVLGGPIARLNPAAGSWRWAFFVVVLPGLVMGGLAWLMREPPRGAADHVDGKPTRFRWSEYRVLLRTPSFVINSLGMTAMTFALGAIAWWMPRYLIEYRHVPDLWGIEPRAMFGGVTVLAGLSGTLAGGWIADRLRARLPGSYFLVSGVALLLSAPCALAFLAMPPAAWQMPFPAAWLMIFLTEFLVFFNTGPTNAILANVSHPTMRSAAFGLNILVIHLFGDAISPPIIGLIAGWTNWNVGFGVVSMFLALGGVAWLAGARYLERDTELAPRRLD